jgi:hypothetical protein
LNRVFVEIATFFGGFARKRGWSGIVLRKWSLKRYEDFAMRIEDWEIRSLLIRYTFVFRKTTHAFSSFF